MDAVTSLRHEGGRVDETVCHSIPGALRSHSRERYCSKGWGFLGVDEICGRVEWRNRGGMWGGDWRRRRRGAESGMKGSLNRGRKVRDFPGNRSWRVACWEAKKSNVELPK